MFIIPFFPSQRKCIPVANMIYAMLPLHKKFDCAKNSKFTEGLQHLFWAVTLIVAFIVYFSKKGLGSLKKCFYHTRIYIEQNSRYKPLLQWGYRKHPFINFIGTSMRSATCSGVIPPSKKRLQTAFIVSPTSIICWSGS